MVGWSSTLKEIGRKDYLRQLTDNQQNTSITQASETNPICRCSILKPSVNRGSQRLCGTYVAQSRILKRN